MSATTLRPTRRTLVITALAALVGYVVGHTHPGGRLVAWNWQRAVGPFDSTRGVSNVQGLLWIVLHPVLTVRSATLTTVRASR